MRAALVMLLCARAALAAPADDLRASGLRSYAVGRYDEAIAAFQRGYQLDPRPDLLYALAQAQRMKGDCKAAVASYRAYLRTAPPERAALPARQNLERCERELSSAPPPVASPAPEVVMPPSAPASPPPRRWQSDRAAPILLGLGAATLIAGGVSWGVGESGARSIADATTYSQFAAREANAGPYSGERIAGIVTLSVGGALAIAAAARWAWVAHHHRH